MNDSLGRRLIQLLGRETVFRLQLFRVSRLRGGQYFFDLGLDSALDGPVVQPALLVLPQPFLGISCVRHDSLQGKRQKEKVQSRTGKAKAKPGKRKKAKRKSTDPDTRRQPGVFLLFPFYFFL